MAKTPAQPTKSLRKKSTLSLGIAKLSYKIFHRQKRVRMAQGCVRNRCATRMFEYFGDG